MQFDQLKRREFITLLGGAAVSWPLAARAQQQAERMRLIGVLMGGPESDPENQARMAAFLKGLAQLGWTTVATCGSTRARARPIPTAFALLSSTRKMGHRVAGLRDLRRHRI
jgi:Tfp pilus assembly protein PilN